MKTLNLPKGSPDPLPELAMFLEPFAPLFRRATTRRSLERYVIGRLPDLPRKNCETIAQAVAGTSLEQLQHQYSGTLGKQGDCQLAFRAEYVGDEPSTSQPLRLHAERVPLSA